MGAPFISGVAVPATVTAGQWQPQQQQQQHAAGAITGLPPHTPAPAPPLPHLPRGPHLAALQYQARTSQGGMCSRKAAIVTNLSTNLFVHCGSGDGGDVGMATAAAAATCGGGLNPTGEGPLTRKAISEKRLECVRVVGRRARSSRSWAVEHLGQVREVGRIGRLGAGVHAGSSRPIDRNLLLRRDRVVITCNART